MRTAAAGDSGESAHFVEHIIQKPSNWRGIGCALGVGMNAQELRNRTKQFAIEVVRLCRRLPSDWDVRELGKQLIRSGTAVAANYRASCRGRSPKEFCAKIGVVAEEADESLLWLELLVVASPSLAGAAHKGLLKEADELTAIFTASYKTAKDNLKKKRDSKRRARRENAP